MLKKITALLLMVFSTIGYSNAVNYIFKPNGDYAVGFKDIHVVEGKLNGHVYECSNKTDAFYEKGHDENDFSVNNQIDFCRELMVRIYYPSNTQSVKFSPYYPPYVANLQSNIEKSDVPGIKQKNIDDITGINTFNISDAPIAPGKFPVIIFQPGSGMDVQQYIGILSNLVSHGYVVVSINNTFISPSIKFPDGRIVEAASLDNEQKVMSLQYKLQRGFIEKDLMYVTDLIKSKSRLFQYFDSHLEANNVGLLAHSAGAMLGVMRAMRLPEAKNFKAGVALDGMPVDYNNPPKYSPNEQQMKGYSKPFLLLFTAGWRCLYYPDKMNLNFTLEPNNYYALLSPTIATQESCKPGDYLYTGHLNYSDFSTMQEQPALNVYFNYQFSKHNRAGGLGFANGKVILGTINNYILQFFNKYLKGNTSNIYDKCASPSSSSLLRCHKSRNE